MTKDTKASADMATAYAAYINGLGLTDEDGNVLELTEGGEGSYTAGSYYEKVCQTIEDSLNNFLADTTFPYTPSSQTMADGGFGGGKVWKKCNSRQPCVLQNVEKL